MVSLRYCFNKILQKLCLGNLRELYFCRRYIFTILKTFNFRTLKIHFSCSFGNIPLENLITERNVRWTEQLFLSFTGNICLKIQMLQFYCLWCFLHIYTHTYTHTNAHANTRKLPKIPWIIIFQKMLGDILLLKSVSEKLAVATFLFVALCVFMICK